MIPFTSRLALFIASALRIVLKIVVWPLVQWVQNEGRCGICGDAHHLEEPRPHEAGGEYAKGTIVRHYQVGQVKLAPQDLSFSCLHYQMPFYNVLSMSVQLFTRLPLAFAPFRIDSIAIAEMKRKPFKRQLFKRLSRTRGTLSARVLKLLLVQEIDVEVELTSNHQGYFEMYVCPNNNPSVEATQECFDRWVFQTKSFHLFQRVSMCVTFRLWYDTEICRAKDNLPSAFKARSSPLANEQIAKVIVIHLSFQISSTLIGDKRRSIRHTARIRQESHLPLPGFTAALSHLLAVRSPMDVLHRWITRRGWYFNYSLRFSTFRELFFQKRMTRGSAMQCLEHNTACVKCLITACLFRSQHVGNLWQWHWGRRLRSTRDIQELRRHQHNHQRRWPAAYFRPARQSVRALL